MLSTALYSGLFSRYSVCTVHIGLPLVEVVYELRKPTPCVSSFLCCSVYICHVYIDQHTVSLNVASKFGSVNKSPNSIYPSTLNNHVTWSSNVSPLIQSSPMIRQHASGPSLIPVLIMCSMRTRLYAPSNSSTHFRDICECKF